jgi:CheY-like chemotaxis protein
VTKKKILIVDDEEDVRASLADLFADEGYLVETAADGDEALRLLTADPPAIVILDLVLPGLDGRTLYDRIRADPKLAGVEIIVSTSDPTKAPPGVPVMKKPLDLHRLLAAVRGRS